MISSDPKVLENSDAARRMEEYRQLVDELYVVVIAGKLNIIAFFRAYRKGSKILLERGASDFLITAQDPAERWLVGWALAKKFHVPLEVQVHTDIKSPYLLRESFKNWIRIFIARFVLGRASCIRVVSRRVRQSLMQWLPSVAERVTVLPVFVDVEKFRLLHHIEEQGTFRFLMISRLTREKNISLAIDAFADIHAQFPQTKLIIVGDGPEKKNLELRVTSASWRNKLQASIVFTGWKEDVGRQYEYANCYLLTSHYEGYGRTVIEALAAGVPVVMTDVGVAGDVVQHEKTGLVVPVGSKTELVKAMRRMVTDSYLRRTLSENGRAAIQSYPSKAAYLEAYKNMWHTCGKKS